MVCGDYGETGGDGKGYRSVFVGFTHSARAREEVCFQISDISLPDVRLVSGKLTSGVSELKTWPGRGGHGVQDFRNILAWQKAHTFVLSVHRETQALPKEEIFGLTMQLRRRSISVAARIAQGSARGSNEEFSVELRKAGAECSEIEYLILVAHDLGYWSPSIQSKLTDQIIEVRKLIFGLIRSF